MDNKIFTQCNIEKHFEKFYKRYSECKDCNIKRLVKPYFDNKYKISIQQKYIILIKIEINYYRNKLIIEIKEAQTIKNYSDHMVNYRRK